ncbi:MAG: hypothetical protein RIR00_1886 [Pseudomonadota bacterium]|jgi:hypothetical protein
MEWQQILETLAALPDGTRQQWQLAAAGLIGLMLALLGLEALLLARRGRYGAWLRLRIVSLLLAPLTLVALFYPAQLVSGMEGLAVFYLSLFTLAPLLWFGGHVFIGRCLRPVFGTGEAVLLGLTGLGILLMLPGTAFFAAQHPLHAAAREIGERRALPRDNPPLPYRVGPVQTYLMPGFGPVHVQSLLAEPGVRLTRIEQRQGGQWPTYPVSHPEYCSHGGDLHLFWSPRENPPPYLRLHWTDAVGHLRRAEFTPQMPAVAPAGQGGKAAADSAEIPSFTLQIAPQGLTPLAPIPRYRVYLLLQQGSGAPYTRMLGGPPDAGEFADTDCLLPGYTLPAWGRNGRIQTVGVMFNVPGEAPGRSVFEAPAAGN